MGSNQPIQLTGNSHARLCLKSNRYCVLSLINNSNMQRNLQYLKRFVVFFIFVILVIIFFFFQLSKKPISNTVSKKIAKFHNLQPGRSTKEDLIQSLGEPVKIATTSAEPFEYNSNSPVLKNKVFLNNDTVTLIKEVVTQKNEYTLDSIQKEYGKYQYKLYGPESESGFNLYVYLNNGFAYLGNEYNGNILEVWYFPVINDIGNFMKNYAPDYSTRFTPPENY